MAADGSNAGLRFMHLTLENWRNFTHASVDLPARVFLVGPSASGKSNLLRVFRFMRNLVKSAAGGGLQAAVEAEGGVSAIRSLAARRNPNVLVKVRLGNDVTPNVWEYELEFEGERGKPPRVVREVVHREDECLLKRPNDQDRGDPARLSQTDLEQVYANQKFREVAEFFRSVSYLHLVPQLVRDPERSLGRRQDPYGGDFLEQVARTHTGTQKARFKRIVRALQAAIPQLTEIDLKRDSGGRAHLRGRYDNWRPHGTWQNEEQFSDGTLRLIGLLWAALSAEGPLLLEEPELSLHPEAVRYIPQMIHRIQRSSPARPQILMSTHSSQLLQDEGIGLDEVLLLLPETEGTALNPAGAFRDVRNLLEGGLSMAEAVLPRTRPEKIEQLPLFQDVS